MLRRTQAFAAAAALIACGEGPLTQVCAPGQSARCACPYARMGTRSCAEDGSGFTACHCGIDGPDLYEPLRALAAEHPDLLDLVDYGDSADKEEPGGWAGCDLLAMRISSAAVAGPKPVVVVAAGYHGNELVGPDIAMRFIRWLASDYEVSAEATWLVDQRELWVIPTVNPDSLGIRRPNANRVDLNRNHSFHWTSGPEHGAGPASEPEVRDIERLLAEVLTDQRESADQAAAPPDTSGMFLTLHGPFAKVVWPWGFSGESAPNADGLAAIAQQVARPTGYGLGQSHEQLYAMPGSATDWVYGTFGVPALLVEIGPSNNATPSIIEADTWPMLQEALVYAATIASAPYELARGPETRILSVEIIADMARVEVAVDDTGRGDDSIASAEAYLSTPPGGPDEPSLQLSAVDGVLDGSVERFEGSLALDREACLAAAPPLLIVQGTDSAGHRGPVAVGWLCP